MTDGEGDQPCCANSRARRRIAGSKPVPPRDSALLGYQRQLEAEGCAAALGREGFHGAAVGGDDGRHDREPEA